MSRFHNSLWSSSPRNPVICLVTDRARLVANRDPSAALDRLVRQVGRAARAGVDLVQLREADLDDRALVGLTERCLDAVSGTQTRIILNDRLDVAVAAGAHGVHLKAESMPGDRARRLAPDEFLIGRSVHSVEEAAEAASEAPDYLILGTIFESGSKPGLAPLGIGALGQAVKAVLIPILAIGGVTASGAAEVARCGAAGIAAISLFDPHGSEPIEAVVREIRRAFEEAT